MVVLGLACVFCAGPARAAAASPAWLPYKLKTDEKLAAERAVEQAKEEITGVLQQAGTFASFMGDSDAAMTRMTWNGWPPRGRKTQSRPSWPKRASARSSSLNEAHHIPMHRAFAMQLARELRKIGYTWLACETFQLHPRCFGDGLEADTV